MSEAGGTASLELHPTVGLRAIQGLCAAPRCANQAPMRAICVAWATLGRQPKACARSSGKRRGAVSGDRFALLELKYAALFSARGLDVAKQSLDKLTDTLKPSASRYITAAALVIVNPYGWRYFPALVRAL